MEEGGRPSSKTAGRQEEREKKRCEFLLEDGGAKKRQKTASGGDDHEELGAATASWEKKKKRRRLYLNDVFFLSMSEKKSAWIYFANLIIFCQDTFSIALRNVGKALYTKNKKTNERHNIVIIVILRTAAASPERYSSLHLDETL